MPSTPYETVKDQDQDGIDEQAFFRGITFRAKVRREEILHISYDYNKGCVPGELSYISSSRRRGVLSIYEWMAKGSGEMISR